MSFILRFLTIAGLLFIFSCEDEAVDTTPPTVTVTFPQNNSSVSEMVTITCISSDNEGVDKVELWVNGVTTGLTDNSEPYSFDWNTTLVDNGNYTITIRSYDTSENTTDSDPIILTVDNTESNPQPINISSVVFNNGGFTITWNPSTDGDFRTYELNKSTDSTMNSASVVFTTDSLEQTTYFDTDIDPLIYQYYQVTVIDTFDYSTQGEIYSSTLDPVPTSVAVESVEYTLEEMTINWSESTDGDFKHYILLYSGSEFGDKTSITTITNQSTISHSITEFNPNQENWFWIEVSDTLGQTAIGQGKTNSLNNQPNSVDVVSVNYDLESMTITWEYYVPNMSRIHQMNQNTRNPITNDFVSYELLQSDSQYGTYSSVVVITDQATTSYSLTEFDPTQENWFKVKVTDFWELNSTGTGMTNQIDSPPTQPYLFISDNTFPPFTLYWDTNPDPDFKLYYLYKFENANTYPPETIMVSLDRYVNSYALPENSISYYELVVSDYWGQYSHSDILKTNTYTRFRIDYSNFDTGYSVLTNCQDRGYVLAGENSVIKLDIIGNIEWQHFDEQGARDIIQTSDGGYAYLHRNGNNLNKIGSTGELIWSYEISGIAFEDFIETSDDTFVLVNTMTGLIKVQVDANASGLDLIWGRPVFGLSIDKTNDFGFIIAGDKITKTDPDGNIVWMNEYLEDINFSGDFFYGRNIKQTSDGGFISYGNGCIDCKALIKIDSQGNLEWYYQSAGYSDFVGSIEKNDGTFILSVFDNYGESYFYHFNNNGGFQYLQIDFDHSGIMAGTSSDSGYVMISGNELIKMDPYYNYE